MSVTVVYIVSAVSKDRISERPPDILLEVALIRSDTLEEFFFQVAAFCAGISISSLKHICLSLSCVQCACSVVDLLLTESVGKLIVYSVIKLIINEI